MADSMAQAAALAGGRREAASANTWQRKASIAIGVLMGLFWIIVGGWKVTHPYDFAALVTQLKVPSTVALPFASILGTGEIVGGLLLLIPAFHRWGTILTSILLLGFMGYMGINYTELHGMDCSCFPWLKRTVSPEFFIGDGAMLAVTLLGGWWASRAYGLKKAVVIAVAVAAFAGGSLAWNVSQQTGTPAPDSITVDGKAFPLNTGKTFLFFFDPQCMHCFHSAQEMQGYKWAPGIKIVVAPVRVPEFAKGFLDDTKLKATGVVGGDVAALRKTFHLTADPPNGVAIENGHIKASYVAFDEHQPKTGLKEIGWIE